MQCHPNFATRFEGATFPVKLQYCGECGLPTEYCSYYPDYEKCVAWLEKNLPTEFEKLLVHEGADDEGEGTRKGGRQKRGGKGISRKKKVAEVQRHVGILRTKRGRNYVTIITGLKTYDIDLKEAAKYFACKFACGSAATAADEIIIQGDVKEELFNLITVKWPEIDEDSIEDIVDKQKKSGK